MFALLLLQYSEFEETKTETRILVTIHICTLTVTFHFLRLSCAHVPCSVKRLNICWTGEKQRKRKRQASFTPPFFLGHFKYLFTKLSFLQDGKYSVLSYVLSQWMFVNELRQRKRQASSAQAPSFLVAMNVCWRAPEKRPLCLKRLSDANAPQSHQRDPTFVTPPAPTLQHIWGQIFHVYVLALSTKHYSTPTLQQIRGQIFHIYFLFLSTKHYSTPTVQHFKGQIFHVYALYLSTSHYATPTFLDWNLDFKGTCHGIIRLDQPFPS